MTRLVSIASTRSPSRDRGVAEPESIDLFLHAARAGLVDMHRDILCRHSGLVLESFGKLRALRSHFVCGLCDIDGQTDLDDFIEVSFSVSWQVRRLALHDPDNLSIEDLHWKVKFASSGRLPGGQLRFIDVLRPLVRGYLPSGVTTTLQAEIGPGAFTGVNVETQAGFMLPVMDATAAGPMPDGPTVIPIMYDGQRFTPAVSVGDVDLDLPPKLPLGADTEQVADEEGLEHQGRIQRRTPIVRAIKPGHPIVDEGKIDHRINLAKQVILRNKTVETDHLQSGLLRQAASSACHLESKTPGKKPGVCHQSESPALAPGFVAQLTA